MREVTSAAQKHRAAEEDSHRAAGRRQECRFDGKLPQDLAARASSALRTPISRVRAVTENIGAHRLIAVGGVVQDDRDHHRAEHRQHDVTGAHERRTFQYVPVELPSVATGSRLTRQRSTPRILPRREHVLGFLVRVIEGPVS